MVGRMALGSAWCPEDSNSIVCSVFDKILGYGLRLPSIYCPLAALQRQLATVSPGGWAAPRWLVITIAARENFRIRSNCAENLRLVPTTTYVLVLKLNVFVWSLQLHLNGEK